MAIPWTRYLPKVSDFIYHLTDLNLLFGDLCFLALTLSNVFVMYRFVTDVLPYPIFITWWQLAQGLLMATILGETGYEFSRFGYFPRVVISKSMLWQVMIPTLAYVAMLTLSNIMLMKAPSVAAYPVLLSFTVVLHHAARFLGCAEEYLQLRWKSIAILCIGFLIGCLDDNTVSANAIPYVISAAIASAIFRAGFLQKVMHVVEGKGNILHNHQHLIGTIILLPACFFCNETAVFNHLPTDFTLLYSWQVIGCLFAIGFIPFAKNVVSNRLIRKTGQAPWRFLELVSIVLVAVFGVMFFKKRPNLPGIAAILLTLLGRSVGAIDVLKNADIARQMEQPRRNQPRDDDNRRQDKNYQTPFLESINEKSDDEASYQASS